MLIMLTPGPVPGLVLPPVIRLAAVAVAAPVPVVPADAGKFSLLGYSKRASFFEARFFLFSGLFRVCSFVVKNLTPCWRILIFNCKEKEWCPGLMSWHFFRIPSRPL